jgi:hypothetical protein
MTRTISYDTGMDRKFQITVNKHQLQLIADCLEDISRFMGGQMELWHATSNLDNYRQLADKLEELQPLVTPELERNASYGWTGGDCPNERQRKLIAETYYLYRTMLYYLHKNDEHWSVYTSPALRCEDSGEVIEIKEI